MKPKRKPGRPKKTAASAAHPSSRDRLLEAALHFFAQNGLEGTTVQEIVDKAGANLSMVSHYFGGKEGLHQACIEHCANKGLASGERVLTTVNSKEEFSIRIGLFVEDFVRAHLEEPEVSGFMQRECLSADPQRKAFFRKTVLPMFVKIEKFVQAAVLKKILRQDLNVAVFSATLMDMIFATSRPDSCSMVLTGKSIKDKHHREELVKLMSRQLFEGFWA